MKTTKITVNMMVRSEIFAPLAICSIADSVSKVLAYDTGSEPEYIEQLYKTQDFFPNIQIVEKQLPNAHSWIQGKEETYLKEVGIELGNIRREMQAKSDSEWVFVIDGDEIVPIGLMNQINNTLDNISPTKNGIFLPFIDLVHDFKWIRHFHHMGRLWKNCNVEVRGWYPVEAHFSKLSNKCLEKGMDEVDFIPYANDSNSVHHMEVLCKPWRKSLNIQRKYEGTLPEILTDPKYSIFQKNILRWL